uniref:Nucleoporin Nup43 n=1 Tax=Phallusia mammillata TaxID=59560 RepID=A0A6F9DM64_9ASCI|nr:nucleoporin Nup43 [Phallusia mammillata]
MAECLAFVSQKMSRVRWQPVTSSLQKPDTFVSGSYDDTVNNISVWGVGHMTRTSNQQADNYMDDIESSQPKKLLECQTKGSVAGMEYVDQKSVAVGLSSGTVSLFKYNVEMQSLAMQQMWPTLHSLSGVTDVAAKNPDLVSVGEDGTINMMRVDCKQPLRCMVGVDSSPITSVHMVTSTEVCTTNMAGQLRMYDARSPSDSPSRIMISSETLVGLCSVDHHPTQGHILATGGADGCVVLFDARKECTPVSKLQIHEQDVWELRFHKTSPEHLFTCSQDGTVRRLDTTFDTKTLSSELSGTSPIEVSELLPECGTSINSLDPSGNLLLCSSDAEAIYIIDNAV